MRIQGDTNQFSPKTTVAHPTRLIGITSKDLAGIHFISFPALINQFTIIF